MIIDAKNSIAGRVASFAAKQVLLGHDILIINCNDAVLTGTRKSILAAYERKRAMGTPAKGPVHIRSAERIMKRMIRGMLPHHQPRGYEALTRIKCFNGTPATLQGKETVLVPGSNVDKVMKAKHLSFKEIVQHIGGKQ